MYPGIPWWVWWYPSLLHPEVHPVVYMPPYYALPGTPGAYMRSSVCTRRQCSAAGVPWEQPGLITENNIGYEAHREPPGPKGVMGEGRTLRIITPLLPVNKCERLDRTRVTPHIFPMVRDLFAEWSSLRPSDR